jgi:hypothetical protein
MTNEEIRMTNECRSGNAERGFGHLSFVIWASSLLLLAVLLFCGCGKKKAAPKAQGKRPSW